MRQSQRILAVVNDRNLYAKVSKPLDRSAFEVNRVTSGAGALILVGNLRYDLILVEAPLPDLELQDFIAAVRTFDSPCVGSSVVVLAQSPDAANLSDLVLEDDVTVVAASDDAADLHSRISHSLGVAVRASARVLVQIEAHIEGGTLQRVGQTANISETGVLLTGTPPIPLGARVDLRLELPDGGRELDLRGEVIRHASPEVENVTGIGVRFLAVEGEMTQRLRAFVRSCKALEAESGDSVLDLDLEESAGSVG